MACRATEVKRMALMRQISIVQLTKACLEANTRKREKLAQTAFATELS